MKTEIYEFEIDWKAAEKRDLCKRTRLVMEIDLSEFARQLQEHVARVNPVISEFSREEVEGIEADGDWIHLPNDHGFIEHVGPWDGDSIETQDNWTITCTSTFANEPCVPLPKTER